MKWEEVVKIEQMLKDALAFYEGCPDGQYDEVAAICIRYAMMMKPWNELNEWPDRFIATITVKPSTDAAQKEQS